MRSAGEGHRHRPSRIAAVVLDMDGLMLDTEPLYKAAWQRTAADLGFDLDDAFYATLVGLPNDAGERVLAERFGPAFPMSEFRRRWSALWRAEVDAAGIPTKPGLLELLSWAETHGLRLAVATSSDREYTDLSLTRAGLDGRFNVVVTVDQVEHGKPAPDLYLEAAHRLGIEPARAVALEDSDAGVLAASRAGMWTIMIPDLHQPGDDARAAAFRVVGSLDDARQVLSALIAEETSGA